VAISKADALDLIKRLGLTTPECWKTSWRVAQQSAWPPDVPSDWPSSLVDGHGPWAHEFELTRVGPRFVRESRPLEGPDVADHSWDAGVVQAFDGMYGVSRPQGGSESGPVELLPESPWPQVLLDGEQSVYFNLLDEALRGFAKEAASWEWLGAEADEASGEVTLHFRAPWGRRFWMTMTRGESSRLLAFGESCDSETWEGQCGLEGRLLDWRTIDGVTLPWRMEYRTWWNTWGPANRGSARAAGDVPASPAWVTASVFERTGLESCDDDLADAVIDRLEVAPGVEVIDERYNVFYFVGRGGMSCGGRVFEGPPIDRILLDPTEWLKRATPMAETPVQ